MRQFRDWPAALQRKWLLSWAAGAAFLTVGITVFLALEDRPLLIISTLLAACVALRCMTFYRTAAGGNYEVITGICVGLGHAGLRRSRTVRMLLTDGTEYENPRTLKQYEKRLRRLQRMLSKKKRGSENWKKLKREIAALHEKIADIRKDAIHKMTKAIVCDSQADAIAIEDLNVSGMMKNNKLSKHIQDASFYEIRRQLEYKCLSYGKLLIIADRFFSSSRICSVCGWHNGSLTLRDREWECGGCHTRHDRDRNASHNLESFGLKTLARDAGEVKPLEMLSVDEGAAMHLRSMASVNEEKRLGYTQEAPKLA